MGVSYNDAVRVSGTGTTVTASATSASVTIPNNASGVRAKFVRLQCTGNLYVKFTYGAGTCTNNDVLLSPNISDIFAVASFDTISYLQEAANPKLNIIPLEG